MIARHAARTRSTPERRVVVALRAGPMSKGSLALVLEPYSIDLDRVLAELVAEGLVRGNYPAGRGRSWALTQAGHLIAHEEARP